MRTTIFSGFPGGARRRGALLLAAAVTIALPLAESTAEAQPLVYYGGGVISNVQIVQVAWTPEVSADRKDKLSDFYKTILGTTYLDWLQEYDTIGLLGVDGLPGSDQHIGRGRSSGLVVARPPCSGAPLVLRLGTAPPCVPPPPPTRGTSGRSLRIDFSPPRPRGMRAALLFGVPLHLAHRRPGRPVWRAPGLWGFFRVDDDSSHARARGGHHRPGHGARFRLARPMAHGRPTACTWRSPTSASPPSGSSPGTRWPNTGPTTLAPACSRSLCATASSRRPRAGTARRTTKGSRAADRRPPARWTGPEGPVCRLHGCSLPSACAGSTPLCDTEANTCVGCLQATDCEDPQAFVCDAKTRSCRGCQSDDECQSGVCDTPWGRQAGQSGVPHRRGVRGGGV